MDIKKLVVDSTLLLAKKKNIENITVQDILSVSGISRSTFYRHFEDKYDVLNWCYQLYVDELISQFDGHNWEEKLEDTLLFVNIHGNYFTKLSHYEETNGFLAFLYLYTHDFYAGVYKRNVGVKALSEDIERSLEFICGGAIMILLNWLRRGRKEKEAIIAKAIYSRLPVQFREYI
ncbi:MAG: hypothetical protein PWQ08_963 [Clostridiales bacterium]|nr:hypothetical protein [Clostridiales bacterium]